MHASVGSDTDRACGCCYASLVATMTKTLCIAIRRTRIMIHLLWTKLLCGQSQQSKSRPARNVSSGSNCCMSETNFCRTCLEKTASNASSS
mmetsp:Transcript_32297/g.49387  ORF Transcript_32297/g.49387 Transcript_32297/m.49387 type:complete len:91 (-) Transcript_32297:347-619(-)